MNDLFDPLLRVAADSLCDVEKLRIVSENRYRQLTRTELDKDGLSRGFGLDESLPSVANLAELIEVLQDEEGHATKNLEKLMKNHPLGPWVVRTRGVGLKQGARLIAQIGDPYINANTNEPRTVAQLWVYAGLHTDDNGAAIKRKKGQQSNWSTNIKMRAYLIAESCIKQLKAGCKTEDGVQHTPNCGCGYRVVYDNRRAKTKGRDGWTDGHSHNDVLRIVSKEILKDLWSESKRIHSL